MSRSTPVIILALLVGAAACADRESGPTAPGAAGPPIEESATLIQQGAQERLARRLALALRDPDFRAYVKGAVDGSPVREHKLHFQRFLGRPDRRALKALARAGGEPESSVDADARSAPGLELYLPVAEHRAAWHGGDEILVATAREDHAAPVAFDVHGKRQILRPDVPPATPVLAVVPLETDFDAAPRTSLIFEQPGPGAGGGPGGTTPPSSPPPPPPPAGLYMTATHFVQDFEGWLKGNPEYEIHILGQSGLSDSLTSYQCVGEHAASAYAFDQNTLDWSGNVLLFSQMQLNSYKAAHPNQNVRILAIEDDDGACQIRLDGNRFKALQTALQNAYPNLTGGKDSSGTLGKVFKRANALQRILRAAYSWLTSQDDLIGNAIEDVVAGEFHAGANWIVRGDNNVTNGWLKLQMR